METTITILIYIHAFFGGIGLITGIGSIVVTKGSPIHKKMGKLFTIGMLVSTLISIPVSCMPSHKNPFLLLIGLFTIYLVLAGNRALLFKTKTNANWKDKLISGSMLFFSIIMLTLGLYKYIYNDILNILYFVFGSIGLLLTLNDFKFYKNPSQHKSGWIRSHIGKMVGALIASITAFLVAGLSLSNLITWILPSIIGTFYIIYWTRKMKSKAKSSKI
ncbi:hypothetical protein WNY78_17100 [Psychroserpens sp. AS72]|uniref:hypothetical protein n=1 Tax=Psychroserpens sp. AS72 TaxID=3135775 RepID=UPI0031783718